MPGIPRKFAEHSLQLFPNSKPVKQCTRRISGPKRAAVEAEVDRLLAAGFIREIKKIIVGGQSRACGEKEHRYTSNVRGFYHTQQMLPERSLPITSNRPDCRLNRRMRSTVFSRRILGLPSDPAERRGRRKNSVHNSHRSLLLHHNAI